MGSSCCKGADSRSRLPSTDTVGDGRRTSMLTTGASAAAASNNNSFTNSVRRNILNLRRSNRNRSSNGVDRNEHHPRLPCNWELDPFVDGPLEGPEYEEFVTKLVMDSLNVMRTLVNSEQETPLPLTWLHKIADRDRGWALVVFAMVKNIPMDDPLGPAMIMLMIDDCPLPTRESINMLSESLQLSSKSIMRTRQDAEFHRNVCVALGCIAGNLAGPNSVSLLTPDTLEYLLANLRPEKSPHTAVILFSLVALEKFAQTSENKVTIEKRLKEEPEHPLLKLESWAADADWQSRQVGFCAQWLLDNLFLIEGRQLTYERIDNSGLNAMLNANDVSEYLKMSSNGLEARCDAPSFESVRCTFQVDSGAWYYEVTLVTNGVMQIGWATKNSKFLNHEGYGIGDDEYSLAYDGCRQLIWHSAGYVPHPQRQWASGDVLGCLLDVDNKRAIFYLNGEAFETDGAIFTHSKSGFFAAASFMTFQQCLFNFGAKPFSYPPADYPVRWRSFNEAAKPLTDDERIVLPRHVRLRLLRECSVHEDSCTLCFDAQASVRLMPCGHTGYCIRCAAQLEVCPMCRSQIEERAEMGDTVA